MTSLQQSAVSRRSFFRYAGAAAAAGSIFTEANFAWAAAPQEKSSKPAPMPRMSLRSMVPNFPPDAVLINANENPLGPSASALAAISAIAPTGGRYDLEGVMLKLVEVFAKQNGLNEDYVMPYAGSSEPLHYSVLAFTGPAKSLVVANPVYEAAGRAATTSKARVIQVPLATDYSHDVRKMVAADPNAGLIYICNPNNPTGRSRSAKTSYGRWRTSLRAPCCWWMRLTFTCRTRSRCWTWWRRTRTSSFCERSARCTGWPGSERDLRWVGPTC